MTRSICGAIPQYREALDQWTNGICRLPIVSRSKSEPRSQSRRTNGLIRSRSARLPNASSEVGILCRRAEGGSLYPHHQGIGEPDDGPHSKQGIIISFYHEEPRVALFRKHDHLP